MRLPHFISAVIYSADEMSLMCCIDNNIDFPIKVPKRDTISFREIEFRSGGMFGCRFLWKSNCL